MKNILIRKISAAVFVLSALFSLPSLAAKPVCEKLEGTYESTDGFVGFLHGELVFVVSKLEGMPIKLGDEKRPKEIVFVIDGTPQENSIAKYSAICKRNKIIIAGSRSNPEREGAIENFESTYSLSREGDLTVETMAKGFNSNGVHRAIYFRTPGKEDIQKALTAKNNPL